MYKILCFDSSNNKCSVSVLRGNKVLSYNEDIRPHMQAENLVPLIEKSLENANLTYQDIDYLAVTTGPGSFTGIRIGLSVALSILHSTNIKSIAVTNFELAFYRLKQQIVHFDKAFIFLDAYRGQQYLQEFNFSGAIAAPVLLDNDHVRDVLKIQTGIIACAGSGINNIFDTIKDLNLLILPRFTTIKSYHIGRLTYANIEKNSINTNVEPLYVRAPDAIKQN